MHKISRLSAAEAQAIVQTAAASAAKANIAMTIVVVDPGGTPLSLLRMDGATPMTFEVGLAKARASALSSLPTSTMAALLKTMPELATFPAFVGAGGGVPILVDGHCIGAVGASGGSAEQDEDIAKAALATLKH